VRPARVVQLPDAGQQRLPERVELELAVDPVAGLGGAAGISGQVEVVLVGNGAAPDGVGRLELRSVGEHAFGDEADGIVEQRIRPHRGYGLPCVALVADP